MRGGGGGLDIIKMEPSSKVPPQPSQPKNEVVSDKPSDCSICMDKFTSTVRRAVCCPYCQEYFCVKCVERYFMNTIEDPHCMACRRGWSQSLLQNFCTKTFLTKTYPEYRSTILLNRSKAFLPRYQEIAERHLAAEKFSSLNEPLRKECEILAAEELKLATLRSEIMKKIHKNEYISYDILNERRDLEGNVILRQVNGQRQAEIQESQERKKFIRRCPVEGCNGFLSSVWKCGICENWSCADCYAVKGLDKDAEHICKTDDKATADLIRKNSKPCPNCGELIEKSMGCDQMFCTSCHVPFSWNKGEVIKTGIVHNPHYFEWLQRNGRNPGVGAAAFNAPCGDGLPSFSRILNRIRAFKPRGFSDKEICQMYQICGHIIDVERNRYNFPFPEDDSKNGVDFLMKKINEDEWKLLLKKNEMSRLRQKEIRDVLDAFKNAAIDIWRGIEQDLQNGTSVNFTEIYEKWCKQLNELRRFINEPLLQISKIYNCVVPHICDDWTYKTYSLTKERAEKRKLAVAEEAAAAKVAAAKARAVAFAEEAAAAKAAAAETKTPQ